MTNFRRLLYTVVLAVGATGLASANQIEQTFSLPTGATTSPWSGSASISQFNTSLGTLEYIEVIGAVTTTVNAGATDAAGGGDTYVVTGTTALNVDYGGSSLLVAPVASENSTFTGVANGQIMSATFNTSATQTSIFYADTSYPVYIPFLYSYVPASEGCSITTSGGPNSSGCLGYGSTSPYTGIVDPLNLSAWEGSGNITLNASAATSGSTSGPSYSNGYANGSATANVTVIYDYTAAPPSSTPEPATMALFGSALIGLGLIRRRSVNKQ